MPEVEDDELEFEEEGHEGSKPQVEQNSGPGSVVESTAKPNVPISTPEFDPRDVTVEGGLLLSKII